MRCMRLFLLFVNFVVVTTLLSIAWLSQTFITPSGDDRLYNNTMGVPPLALKSGNTHTRGQSSHFHFSDQNKSGAEWQQGEPTQADVQRRETLHITADGQKRYQQDEEAVTHVGTGVIQNTRETSPQKVQTSPSVPDNNISRQAFSLPVPFATLPLSQILQTQWLKELRDYVSTLKPHSGPITLVSSDYKFREVLLNWLISALVQVDRPLSNVLVLSLDPSLRTLLQARGFACIHIPPESLLRPTITASLTSHVAFTQVHVLRLTVMRFLNHWGFDVANYDADAIIIKNPEPLFYQKYGQSDFIGSYGHSPYQIRREWGIAVCIGVVMIKSSKHTEHYWEAMSHILPQATNDQAKLNMALKAMNISWSDGANGLHRPILREAWQGSGRGGFTTTVLPSIAVCRSRDCSRHLRSFCYVWHKGGKQARDEKRKNAGGAGLWYLRSDWMAVSNGTTSRRLQWLKAIAH